MVIQRNKWKESAITGLCHIVSNNCFEIFNDLLTEYNTLNDEYINYITLKHSVTKQTPTDNLNTNTHKFENLLFTYVLFNNMSKTFYITFNEDTNDQFKPYELKWIRDLHIEEDNISCNDVWNNARKPFQCTKNKLRQFKIVNQMYYTLLQLHKMSIREGYKCIKCDAPDWTLIHLLWNCNKMKDQWFGITKQALIHVKINIPSTPQTCILRNWHTFCSVSSKNKYVFLHFVWLQISKF